MADDREPRLNPSDDERVADTLARTQAPMSGPAPGLDDFDERLRHLETRASSAQSVREAARLEAERKESKDNEGAAGLAKGMTIAYTIIGLPLLGVFVGWFLDRPSGGHTYTQIGVLAGAVTGMAMAFVLVGRGNKGG